MDNLIASSSFLPNVNFRMFLRNVRTGETKVIEKHNRFLKFGIYGIVRWLNGEFNTSTPQQIQNYIPRYLALGSNLASGNDSGGVTTEVTVNDTRLLSELKYDRARLTQRNIITNRYNDPYIKLTIKHYIPVTAYVGESIAEAGLFAESTGNNAIARITFDRFIKDEETVIDVTWEITIVSMESENAAYVSIDKQDLKTSIESALDRIGANYLEIKDLCDAIKSGVIDYGRSDVSQQAVDSDTSEIQRLTYPLDNFIKMSEPYSFEVGDVVKYDITKKPTISCNKYPCGNYLELNNNMYDRFGIFTNDGERIIIGYARLNGVTNQLEYSNIVYDSQDERDNGWVGCDENGIKEIDDKIVGLTTGFFVKDEGVTVSDWDWTKDWLKRELL